MKPTPRVSVVIPAYNEELYITPTLEALGRQSGVAPQDYEVIVVDNNCTDRTAAIARLFGARVVAERRAGVGYARSAGFAAATAPLIATTDADTVVPKNWLKAILAAFDDQQVVAVGGPGTYDIEHDVVNAVVNRSLPYLHELDRLIAGTHHLVGFNMAVRASAFVAVGGWNEALAIGEDLDLSQRLAAAGKVTLLPDLRVTTSDRRFQRVGPQQLMTYFANYLEVTRPGDALRKQLEAAIARLQESSRLTDKS